MKALFLFLLLLFLAVDGQAEEAPPLEPPYPAKRQPASEPDFEQPIRKDSRGGLYYKTDRKRKKKRPYKGIEQPQSIGEDGAYYYKTDSSENIKSIQGVESPIESDEDGAYYYNEEKTSKKRKNLYGPQPTEIRSDGAHFYNQKIGKTKNNLYFRGGSMSSPDVQPATEGGRDFSQVYGESNNFLITIEYDWLIMKNLFLKLGSGITSTKGEGQFSNPNISVTPQETFQFYIFPTALSAHYRLKMWDIQWFTPYIEAGPGYFSFIEVRSDGDGTKFGGAPVALASAGFLFSLSQWMDGTSMNAEYGVTNTWIDLQFKQVLGLDSRKDFTSNIITGGFAVGF